MKALLKQHYPMIILTILVWVLVILAFESATDTRPKFSTKECADVQMHFLNSAVAAAQEGKTLSTGGDMVFDTMHKLCK